MSQYEIRSPLHHDGGAYAVGDVVDAAIFTAAQTEHLIMTGTLVPAAEHPSPAQHEGGGGAGAPAETPPPTSPAAAAREHPAPSEGQGLSGAPAETPSPASSARKGKGD